MGRSAIAFAFLVLLSVSALSLAVSVDVISPVKETVSDGGTISIGRVGPGQTFSFTVDPKVLTGGKHNIGGRWDIMQVKNVPYGWSSRDSKIYADPMQAEVTVSPLAQNGKYNISAVVVDEGNGEELGTVNFKALVDVDRDVMDMSIAEKSIETGAGQPARYEITITNTGSADDVFEVSTTGIKSWEFRRRVYVGAGASKTIEYEVVGEEEGEFDLNVKCVSTSSPLISKSDKIHLTVRTNLISDYKATNHGLLLFPILEQPVYSLMGLISNLFR